MVRNIESGELSAFRTELMGMSALLILICHVCGYVNLSKVALYTLSLGNIGVDLFLFLSVPIRNGDVEQSFKRRV